MAIATKRPHPPTAHPTHRMWKAPLSRANWLWLVCSVVLYAGVYLWYLYGLKIQQYPGPSLDPFRYFGIISFGLVVIVATYSLRRCADQSDGSEKVHHTSGGLRSASSLFKSSFCCEQ